MNKREKEVQQAFLNNEKAVLKKLEENYEDALAEINDKIALLMGRQDADQQHVVYQLEFQRSLKAQVSAILETLHSNEFETISEYLTKSYEDGFISTMYNLQGQGIPLIFPLDQEQIVNAIQTESKLSTRSDTKTGKLYASLGDDIKDLQKKITGEISRGIAGGQMYSEVARNISNWAKIPKNNAMRITRTEMHRIQEKATMDVHYKAQSKGADIVKIWSAALDMRTRDSHAKLDGEIRELDEEFSNGLQYPGDPSGKPEEVINCRCRCNSKARWLLGSDYTKWSVNAPVLVDDDGTTQLAIIEAKDYKDFSKKYKQAVENIGKSSKIKSDIVSKAIETGKVSTTINTDKQNRHIKGSKDYIDGRSYIKGTAEDAQKLVDELSGTGEPVYKPNGEWNNKEKVTADKVIGVNIDPKTLKESDTTKATIHYSKTGSHIIPRKDG